MKLKIKTTYYDYDPPSIEEDIVEVDGTDLISCVAKFVELSVEQLKDQIKTRKWNGGQYEIKGNKIVWESDVVEMEYSLA